MMQCLNTGHDGSMSTGHANSGADMVARLENMILMGMDIPLAAIKKQIASGLDIIVHLGRLRDKSRRLLEITEIAGFESGEYGSIRCFGLKRRGRMKRERNRLPAQEREALLHEDKLKAAGLS